MGRHPLRLLPTANTLKWRDMCSSAKECKVNDLCVALVKALVRDHVNDQRWGAHAQRIDSGEMWCIPRGGGHDDHAHPPIHPTRWSAGEANWSPDKARLYEFIVRSFLASCSKPAVGFQTTVDIRIAEERFSTTGERLPALFPPGQTGSPTKYITVEDIPKLLAVVLYVSCLLPDAWIHCRGSISGIVWFMSPSFCQHDRRSHQYSLVVTWTVDCHRG